MTWQDQTYMDRSYTPSRVGYCCAAFVRYKAQTGGEWSRRIAADPLHGECGYGLPLATSEDAHFCADPRHPRHAARLAEWNSRLPDGHPMKARL